MSQEEEEIEEEEENLGGEEYKCSKCDYKVFESYNIKK